MTSDRKKRSLIATVFALFAVVFAGGISAETSQNPVVLIPGVTGSELVNKDTGEIVWLRTRRSKNDDLRLPVTSDPLKSRDALVAGDVLRAPKIAFLPRFDVYQSLIDAFKTRAGYHEESWEDPTAAGGEKAFYVFPYDWRLDNVENARRLVKKIEALRVKLKKPGLKFDVIAHSMGGLIARYAAMYGDTDLPPAGRKVTATWAGAKLFDKIVLLGTPSEGSPHTLGAFVNGFSLGPASVNLPFVQNISRFDVFTIPAAYELLPAPGTFHAVDENFEPIAIDLYDPKVWTQYGWNPIDDKKFNAEFSAAERKAAPTFFTAMLDRAKRFHEALEAVGSVAQGVKFDLVGSECRETLDTVIIRRDLKKNVWRTLFRADSFLRANGDKVTSDELKKIIYVPGDGTVTRSSFEASAESKLLGVASLLRPASSKYVCEDHNKLGTNIEIQDHLISLFGGK